MRELIKQAKQRNYDGTVARIAGNLLSGWANEYRTNYYGQVKHAVEMARAIVAEVKRTERGPSDTTEG